ncbi:MAG TPA: peptidoglycan recognition family protein [Isosphaeraceae bacterium]
MIGRLPRRVACALLLLAPAAVADEPRPKSPPDRKGDEIIVCGQFVHTGAPVVTWIDPGGYDAYDTKLRFPAEAAKDAPAELKLGFGDRNTAGLDPALRKKVSEKDWDLSTLQQQVDQFVIHYDVCGTSKQCFKVLHDGRGLAVQFMLDLDGTIYQTLDLKEGAWHATKANGRSVGVEIANMGATTRDETSGHFAKWYKKEGGETVITIPGGVEKSGLRDKSAVLKPIRPDLISGPIHGEVRQQYDLTPQQYDSLIKLTATLHRTFPKINLDYPRGSDGKVLLTALSKEDYEKYHGVLGHWHVQLNKQDPGPAFQWDKVIEGAKAVPTTP